MVDVAVLDGTQEGERRLGWLYSLGTAKEEDRDKKKEGSESAVMCYFISPDGSNFRCRIKFLPYFYLQVAEGTIQLVEGNLRRRFDVKLAGIETVQMEDLDMKNHLSGKKAVFLKLSFRSVQQLMEVREELSMYTTRKRMGSVLSRRDNNLGTNKTRTHASGRQMDDDPLSHILDLREYDVPYHIRFCIDENVRCGQWYTVQAKAGQISLQQRPDLLQRAEPIVCAFDIETTKLPLQFPNAEFDQIYMISYMMDKQGYLIVNRQIVSQHIEDFSYTPKPEFVGPFKVLNVDDEADLLRQWFLHMKKAKPSIFVTYNGDFFDWPFIQKRAEILGMDMKLELGFFYDDGLKECRSPHALHMDCFYWVKRDSYLPQGSQSLKAVTKAKLGYNPVEVDPENMTKFAVEQPQLMATYSVSDAVATYYLYMTYVHPFIFSLSNIIPMPPDDVLRKGSGTLCESLLMVEAFAGNIICPNKATKGTQKFHNELFLDSETYIGGHVECLESGVFRSDIPTHFRLTPSAFQMLADNLDRDIGFELNKEGLKPSDIENYSEVKDAIHAQLMELMGKPVCTEKPLIYHLDVSAMYPNIILTNRLQPPSVVDEQDCFACDFNSPNKTCLKTMEWTWRGETFALTRSEYMQVKAQVENENQMSSFGAISKGRQMQQQVTHAKIMERLKSYCQKVYKRVNNKPLVEQRIAGICQRENPFYVNTVQKFRDRRYEYKALNKKWNAALRDAKSGGDLVKVQEAEDMCVLYDSLQLAHKCILNSFYGYVMRKGARWYSMEMAGVVTHTGAKVIQRARQLIEQVGKPLELDTDGIWCCLPGSFPESYIMRPKEGVSAKPFELSYPCAILNADVAEHQTNHQYQELVDQSQLAYETSSRCSIEFEVDGPYLAMVLPASKEEDKLLKKRYAVFNLDRKLAELKGFELKRRGELKLVKIFQAEVFDQFLHGETLEQCYAAVAHVANRWLDMLDTRGSCLDRDELLDLISESSTMSKSLDAYGGKKSCALTTAKRISEFLGDTHLRERGLKCTYIIAQKPEGTSISERAIPVSIFYAEPAVACAFLQKWTKDSRFSQNTHSVPNPAEVLDWEYYFSRLGSTVQKIITIPAALQGVQNPVPRIKHPDWLHRRLREKDDTCKQRRVSEMFTKLSPSAKPAQGELAATLAASESKEDAYAHSGEKAGVADRNKVAQEMPSRREDYVSWLRWRKRKWVEMAERPNKGLKRSEDGLVLSSAKGTTGATNVKKFFHMQHTAAMNACWQVLSLVPQHRPGIFDLWILVDGSMYRMDLTVKRNLFLELRGDHDFCIWPTWKSSRIPPRGMSSSLLNECSILEEDFLSVGGRSTLLAHGGVRCVFQSKLSLSFHAVVEVGCVCSLQNRINDGVIGGGVELTALHMNSTAEFPYLSENALPHCVVLSASQEGSKACIVLFIPTLEEAHVFFIEPAIVREVSSGAGKRLYQRQARGFATSGSIPLQIPEDCDVNVDYVTSFPEAVQQLQARLRDHIRHKLSNLVMLLDGSKELMGASATFRKVLSEMPLVCLPHSGSKTTFEGLQWKANAVSKAFLRSIQAIEWFKDRLDLANYACIPIGAFEGDPLVFTADVLFARRLKEAGILSWASDTDMPDLGGQEIDEPHCTDTNLCVEITRPGIYRECVVEVRVSHLDVNAVCNRSLIEESNLGNLNGQQFAACNYTESTMTLSVLKGLVEAWVEDATKYNQHHANSLLLNLYRWICSPCSRFYDPSLQTALKYLMSKALLLLIAEIDAQGLGVVYADSNTLLIRTGVHGPSTALERVEFALETLRSREQFRHLHFDVMEQWKVLLFKDLFHYGGIQRDQKEGMDATALPEGEGSERESFRCSWTSAGTSPKSIQRLWLKMVSAFISLDTSGMHEDRSIPWNDGISKSVSRADTHTDAERIPTEDEVWENTVNQFLTGVAFHSCLEVLSREFPGALRTETAIQQHEQASASFQNKSDVESSNAFLSSLFEMLRLERKAKLAVEDFCTKMSRVFHVDETGSKIVVSDDPTSTLVDVACEACGHVRSIDLDRDPDVSRGQWRCIVPDCMSKYDMRLIERKACKQLEKNVCAYSIQDVRCTSCDQVSCGRLDRQCPCGGVLDVHHKPNGLVSTIQRMMQRSIRHDLLYARSSSERIDAHAFHGVESENDLHETWMERIIDAF